MWQPRCCWASLVDVSRRLLQETQRQFKETILQTKRRPPVFQVLEERGRAQQAALEAERRQRWEESTAPKRFWVRH